MQADYDATTLDAAATVVTGLTTGTTYYAIRVDKDKIKLAASLSDANAGNAISLSGEGTLSQFFIGRRATVSVAQTGGVIDGFTVTDGGSGYQNPPSITISDSGSGAGGVATCNLGYSVNEITVGIGGTYSSAPSVTITNNTSDTTGSGATGTATIGFPIASVNLTGQGLSLIHI